MKDLIKIALILAAIFAATFVMVKATGLITIDGIQEALALAQQTHSAYIAAIVVGLLFSDLFIAVPTMTVSILAGFFLGWPMGAAATLAGLYLAGITGYVISRVYGFRLLNYVYNDKQRLIEIQQNFAAYGPVMLIICRALPILPEVSCCLAGATRMPFFRFLTMYSLGTIPYALIVTYSGSISSLDKPMPAILTAIGVTLTLWLSWFVFSRRTAIAKPRATVTDSEKS